MKACTLNPKHLKSGKPCLGSFRGAGHVLYTRSRRNWQFPKARRPTAYRKQNQTKFLQKTWGTLGSRHDGQKEGYMYGICLGFRVW